MGSSPNLSVTWTPSVYNTKSTYNYSTNDTNVWQSQTTTISMTPTCGSHDQLQYRWHQHVAVTDNYNTDDTNKWQSQTTYKWTTSQSMINLFTMFKNWTHHSSQCAEPYDQYQSYYGCTQWSSGKSAKPRRPCCLTYPLLTANVNTNYLRLL